MKRRDELQELRSLPANKLSDKITESQKQLILLEQDRLLGKIKNTRQLSTLRRSVARMKTILDEKITAEIENK